jgi:hypothetical protein
LLYLKHLIVIFSLIVLFTSISKADNPIDDLHYKEAQRKILEALYIETGLESDVQKTIQYVSENYSNRFIEFAMPIVNIAFKKRIEVRYEF